MQSTHDFEMALKLQQAFDTEYRIENPSVDLTYNDKKKKSNLNTSRPKGLIDPSWELVDPTPNIHVLFVQFNERFFWNKLLAVTVSWSKRMTVCAGVCSYQGRGGLCAITLSEPLLKLRPRKDLIETLLHEMIHAYLFITNNDRDRDGHGPNFHKHMYRINNEAGTNISVYHDFHDEVRLYQQHWWRCDGPCHKRPPFFGMVRRSMNRAPGPNDRWWPEHQKNCNGKFIKVKEPEKQEKPTKGSKKPVPGSPKKSPTNLPDIRDFFPVVKSPNSNLPNNENKENIHTINDTKPGNNALGAKNKNGTVVLNPKTGKNTSNDPLVTSVIPSSSNIKGFSNSEPTVGRNNIEAFSGTGRKLSNSTCDSNPAEAVRNHWADKFVVPKNKQNTPKRKSSNDETEVMKKSRVDADISCPNCDKKFAEAEINAHLDRCLNADASILSAFSDDLNETDNLNNDSVKLVECPVCNTMIEEDELNGHLDECLNKPTTSSNKDENKKCEICEKLILLVEFDAHVLECLTKCYDNYEEVLNTTTDSLNVSCLVCNKDIVKEELNLHLEDCMVSVFDKNNIGDDDVDEENSNNAEDKNEINDETNENNDKKYNCPICMSAIDEMSMNRHIDECLNTVALKNEIFD